MVDARLKGKGRRYHCTTKEEAKTLAEQLRIKLANSGSSAFDMPTSERMDAQASLELLRPHGKTLLDATRFYLKHIEVIHSGVTLASMIAEMQRSNEQDGYAEETMKNRRRIYTRFSEDHPGILPVDVTSPMVEKWLRAMPISGLSRNTYRGKLGTLFAYALKRKYVLVNPIDAVAEARVVEKEPGIISVDACSQLLEAVPARILPSVALGMFAGLRPQSEVMRLRWEHINFETRLIDIAADRTKTSQKRFVRMLDALVEWLLPHRKNRGAIYDFTFSMYKKELYEARMKAGILLWPVDALRHTYGTMHYEHFQDAGATAKEMGHQGTNMLFRHYRARVTPAEATAFWNIRPGRESNIVPMVA